MYKVLVIRIHKYQCKQHSRNLISLRQTTYPFCGVLLEQKLLDLLS